MSLSTMDPDEESSEWPVLRMSPDGVYPRCVYCAGENYVLAVLAYSAGEVPCAAVASCGRMLPQSYIRGE